MLQVAQLPNAGLAVDPHHSYFPGGKLHLSVGAFLGHKLCIASGRTEPSARHDRGKAQYYEYECPVEYFGSEGSFPGLISALSPEITMSPTLILKGARMYRFSPSK